MEDRKVVSIDPREFLSPIKITSSFVLWDRGLNFLKLLDDQHNMNAREQFTSMALLNAYNKPETKIYYYESGSVLEPQHAWIHELIDEGLVRITEAQPGHYMEPSVFNVEPPDSEPNFYYVSKEIYDWKKTNQPGSRSVEMYESWPQFTRYEIVITKRAERKLDLLAQAKNMEEVLGKQPTKLADAVSIEVPFGIGKVDVVKLWQYFKSS